MFDTSPAPVHWPAARNCAPLITVRGVSFWYGAKQALDGIDLDILPGEVLALMGPSGCGKTTLLRLLNRMQETTPGTRLSGEIRMGGQDIFDPEIDPPLHRRRFGWVAQKPNPFPKSVRENVAYGARIHSVVEEGPAMDAHVRRCLERASLWEELGERLETGGTDLSGGQQQRLCIARALAIEPEVLLMDEPCASIDPIATAAVEALIGALKRDLAIVVITHNLQQARRVADRVAFFKLGRMLECGPTEAVFADPRHPETRAYLEGAFG